MYCMSNMEKLLVRYRLNTLQNVPQTLSHERRKETAQHQFGLQGFKKVFPQSFLLVTITLVLMRTSS